MSYYLGISCYFHDSAAALVKDGRVIAAAQQERFSRIKHDPSYPREAVDYVLAEAGITIPDLDRIVYHEKPFLHFERLLETYLSFAPRGLKSFALAFPKWAKEKLYLRATLEKELGQHEGGLDDPGKLLFSEHHLSHAVSAYYPSPFDEAVILTMDGVGEWATSSVSVARGNALEIKKEIHFPHSLGLLYSAFTYYLGFRVNSGEYKVMGLAPYGQPRHADQIRDHLIDIRDDGSFRLNMRYFAYCTDTRMVNKKFTDLFGRPPRKPDCDPIETFHLDIAASVQKVTEEIVLKIGRHLADQYKIDNLCMAGGVALNCVANGVLRRDGCFRNIWVQPAAGDAGGALGAAWAIWMKEQRGGKPALEPDMMSGMFLGPGFSDDRIRAVLDRYGARYQHLGQGKIIVQTAEDLEKQHIVGWFQGRMEFGPRALGARSILGDPRNPRMQKLLNEKIKFREGFRPFAPAVLQEDLCDWFDASTDNPYMLFVGPVSEGARVQLDQKDLQVRGLDQLHIRRSRIPAVTHVDYSARVQSVNRDINPLFHALISAFKKRTGCPVIVNTSFNVRGEPIVCSPEDALRCFMTTNMDILAVGGYYLVKKDQPAELFNVFERAYKKD